MLEREPTITRSAMSREERLFRSELALLASARGLLRGTLLERYRVCGNPRCKCARGQKHRAVYLMLRENGRLRQLFIPTAYEQRVRQWVANHHQIKKLLKEIGEVYWKKVQQRQG
jgi:hypothetical protein